jgi:hypothetical protein
MRRLVRPLWIIVAVLFLVEAWLWRRLSAAIGWVVQSLGLARLKSLLAAWVERLPPVAALFLFLVPALALLPLKLMGLWMLAHGHWLGALATLVAAKLAGVGVTAFIFQIARPKLLRLWWFAWAYRRVQAALGWAHRQLDPITIQLRAWRDATRGRLLRRLVRLRRRAQRI